MSAIKSGHLRPWRFLATAVAGFLVIAVLLFFFFGARTKEVEAQVVNFYPTTCLGGWENPVTVEGEPEVVTLGDRYNEANSAVYKDNQSSLYCGAYTGSIPAETKHTEVVLRFSWTQNVTDAPVSYPQLLPLNDLSSSSVTSTGSSTATSTSDAQPSTPIIDQILELLPPEGDSSESPESESPETPPSVPEVEPQPEEIPVQEEVIDEPESPPAEEPISLRSMVFETAFAQEVEEVASDAQFRIEFTLDGATWATLGYISDVSNDIKLTFPQDAFLNVEDIGRVQIGVVPLLRIETAPQPVYLDAMWLEVEYAPVVQPALHNPISHTPQTFSFSELTFTASTSLLVASTSSSTVSEALILPETVLRLHGIDKRFVLVHTQPRQDVYRLWLLDLIIQEATLIADDVITIGAHKGGVKDKMIFWYSANRDKVYVYDLRTAGTYHELLIVQNLPPQPESLVYEFPFTTWKLVDGPEEFYFRSDETGEVFSDGVSEGVAQFVLTFGLYREWSKEDLERLGLGGL